MTEHDLIKRLLDDDEKAYRQIVTDFQPSMLYVARAIVGTAIADEVVQEAWMSIIKALPKFEGRSSLKTWVLRIVSNNAKSRLRKESRHFSAGDAADLEVIGMSQDKFNDKGHWVVPPSRWNVDSPDALLTSHELQTCVRTAMDNLPAIQQTILSLRDMDGMSMQEICKILEISESNSRVLLHRARIKVFQAIDKFQGN